MTTRIDVQISFEGKTPLVASNKYLTMTNLAQLLNALNHGSRYRSKGVSPVVKVTPSMVRATGTITVATPTTGQTVTIAGTALTAQQSRARATLTFASSIAGDTVVINGQTFTAVNGAVTPGQATFDIRTSNTLAAASLVAQVNAYGGSGVAGLVTLKSAAAVATVIANAEGTSGNAITLTTTGGTITASGATLSGGAAVANNKFDFGSTDAQVAASLARAITASTTAAVQQVIASVVGAVVTLTAHFAGTAGNALTLASASNTTLAVSAATLTGGTQGATTVYNF